MAAGPVLIADQLAVGRGGHAVVAGIDLELRRGELVAVLGPNGAGKSTLLATLAGLLAPVAGQVSAHGRVAAALQAPALAKRSVRANMEAALAWWGVPRPERAERALAALEQLHAGALADRPAATLSGGEARRVHLARALALRADALLLDEPFAGLDAPTRAELLSDAASILRDDDRATLVVLHDRAEAWALADRLIVLLDGKLAAHGEPRAVLEQPPSRAVARFLGFSGVVRENGGVRCVRPAQVALDPGGPLRGVVARRIPEEDGVLCEVALDGGTVQVRRPYPGPSQGEAVNVRLDGGVHFADEDA
jgi:ABC-type sugar transport system ATPase subunit